MRKYVDEVNNRSNSRRTRKRVYHDSEFAPGKETAPKNAPAWTISGYDGSLKIFVQDQVENNDNDNAEENSEEAEEHESSHSSVK